MPLRPDQLLRLQSRFAGLSLSESCTVVDSWFGSDVELMEGASIVGSKIGAGSRLHPGASVHSACIGRQCTIGEHCILGEGRDSPEITIGDDVSIGAHSRVAPGVTIGHGVILPERSIVTGDLPASGSAPSRESLVAEDPDHALPLQAFLLEKRPLVHMYHQWCADRGDETLRVEYPVSAGSILIDVGGYHGDWAAEMVRRYGATVHVFEPVRGFAEGMAKRFSGESRIRLHRYGLAGRTRSEQISLASEGSSIVKQGPNGGMETIQLVAAGEVFRQLGSEVAVLKINIEGCEYELLDHLLDEGLLNGIRHLQVQFHEFAPDARHRRRAIRERLRATHVERWNYPFLWEGWERRGHGE